MSGDYRIAFACAPCLPGEPCGDAAGHWPLAAAPDAAASAATSAATSAEANAESSAAPAAGLMLALVDGLGHGAAAARAADAALQLVAAQPALPLTALMNTLDRGLRGTRGAAVGLARWAGGRLQHAAVGNTRALRWRGEQWLRLPAQYGIVGDGLRRPVQLEEIDLQPGDWWLMFSDGLPEMLHLQACLPEWRREPERLCRHLLGLARPGADDVGVLALHLEDGP